MAKNPYEWIYERQSQPLKTYVLDEVAKMLAAAVEKFPPPIESWEREDLRARFEPVLAAMQGPPERKIVREALVLYRMELERDVEAIDAYVRNERWQAAQLSPQEYEVTVFLWQYWLEQTLAFKQYAGDKFRWSELIGLADRLERQLNAAPQVTAG